MSEKLGKKPLQVKLSVFSGVVGSAPPCLASPKVAQTYLDAFFGRKEFNRICSGRLYWVINGRKETVVKQPQV